MNTSEIDELQLKSHLHSAEQNLDAGVVAQLASARSIAIGQQNNWLKDYIENLTTGYRGLLSASAVTTALAGVLLLPFGERFLSVDEVNLVPDDSVTLLMEDPEFYLWLNESGMLVAER